MNRIYKVIWSKVKHQYVVTSEFAHSCTKSTGRTLGRSAAAVLAVLVLTTGIGAMPVQAITDENNNTYYDTETNIVTGKNNYVETSNNIVEGDSNIVREYGEDEGDGNTIKGNSNSMFATGNYIVGNENELQGNGTLGADYNVILGDLNHIFGSPESFIVGNRNNLEDSEYPLSGEPRPEAGHVLIVGNDNDVDVARNSTVYGNNNVVHTADNSTAIGNGISIYGLAPNHAAGPFDTDKAWSEGNVAIGANASIGGIQSVLESTKWAARGSIAIGADSLALGQFSNAIGQGSAVIGQRSTGIGHDVRIGNPNKNAEGEYNPEDYQSSVAIGDGTILEDLGTQGGYSSAVGVDIHVQGARDTVMGKSSIIRGNDSSVYGYQSKVYGDASIAIGNQAAVGEDINDASGSPTGDADNSIALGHSANVKSEAKYAISVGEQATVSQNGSFSIAVGYKSSINDGAQGAMAIGGYQASASELYATALGSSTNAQASYSTAIGYDSSVEEGADNSTSIGSGSTATKEDILSDDDVKAFIAGLDTSVLGGAYNDFYNIQNGDAYGVISVGTANSPRRIINVAKGRIGPDSTDAVNGSQLYGAVAYLDGRIDVLENSMGGGGEILPDDDNVTIKHPDGETTTGGAGTGGTGSTTPGGSETGSGEGGTGGTGAGSGTTSDNTHYVGLNEDVVLGDTMDDGSFNSGSLTVQKDAAGNAITINKEDENGVGDGLVSGLNNTDWDWNTYEQGGYAESSNAATEAQLHGAMEGAVQYDRNEDGTVNKSDIYLDQGGTVIHNVAAGTADTDAVNVSQLNEAWDQINNNTTAITNIGNKVGELDSRIDEVGAGAAALAALHPLDFDPDDKWDFAAGYGNYRGENAVAIGAFYRPNEDTMFSVGGTVGNDDNMVNAGVSFKIGQGNGVSTSRVAMAKEIKDLRRELEAMKSAMLDVNAGRKLDTSKLQLFPDVPQNHWAYEYVATLAGNGVIEGYPDGNFDGARPMTRYEFAAMLYRAMLNGAKLSDKILTEFAPELERFTVDVVHTDSDGNPTVERVRVVKQNKDTTK